MEVSATALEQLQREVAELAIRLLAHPACSLPAHPDTLAEIERLAREVLQQVASARAAAPLAGERRGAWRILQPRG